MRKRPDSSRFFPRFGPASVIAKDPLLEQIAVPLLQFPAIGRRLVQQDALNPNGGVSPNQAGSGTLAFIGGVASFTDENGVLGVAIRVASNISKQPIWFQLRNGDAKDIARRIDFGMIVGFCVRYPVYTGGASPELNAINARGFHIPHGFIYVP